MITARVWVLALSVTVTLGVSGPTGKGQGAERSGTKAATPSEGDPVLVGAGDIASCDDLAGAEATAKLIDKIPGTVFAADLAFGVCNNGHWAAYHIGQAGRLLHLRKLVLFG